MVRTLLLFLLLAAAQPLLAQGTLSGQVTDTKGKPVAGANVYLDNTLDGGTSDSAGRFRFTTTEKGAQTIIASAVGFEQAGLPVTVNGDVADILLRVKASAQNLEGVTITAGAMEASNDKNKAVLSTLDVLTTAGANADMIKAIQTLPGTQQQGTQTGLFVRGGDAAEAAVIVDGLVTQNAYFTGAPGVATRSRFAPWSFKGVSFSSGGYSARYGQALSSVLELNTLDFPDKTTVNLGLHMAGVYASGAKLWKQSSGELGFSYNNLKPFYSIASTNVDYYDVPTGVSGNAKYAWKPAKDGILKLMVSGSRFNSGVQVDNPDSPGQQFKYGIGNTNCYSNLSYRQQIKNKWSLFAAASYSYNKDDINAGGLPIHQRDDRAQGRLEIKRFLTGHFSILAGAELQHFTYRKEVGIPNGQASPYTWAFTENAVAGFAEGEWSPTRWIALRPGVRYEHSALLGQHTVAPRLSLALRTGKWSQIGLAGGSFYQLPDMDYLIYGYRPGLQQAIHYIANFQWIRGDRTFRVEGYYKDYAHLVRELSGKYDPNTWRTYYSGPVDNSGSGYARGLDLFWRDKKTVKNLDYWVSYSYIDTRRLYKNFPVEATPAFISDHNLSLVSKYWIDKWQTQINMTYSYATGRPYYNPNNALSGFLADRTPDYHNLALTVNYLTHIKKWFTVVYAGVDNLTNRKNVFGYRYATDGSTRYAQYPALFRSFFVGANFSLTEFNKDEL